MVKNNQDEALRTGLKGVFRKLLGYRQNNEDTYKEFLHGNRQRRYSYRSSWSRGDSLLRSHGWSDSGFGGKLKWSSQ
jgi:hypothetical protein